MSTIDPPGLDVIGEAFSASAGLAPEDRAAYLSRLEETDPDLARRLRLLLENDATPPAWLRDSAVAPPADIDLDAPPPAIPGFEIVGVLGAGGMGVVFKARQLEPDRLVAIKTIRPELLDARRRELFQREIAALARLRHPAIAHIYAAGMDRNGSATRPWFAMELVEGMPLLGYFAARRSPRADRLRLLARVADAIGHAHALGVIHRDLKPSNILVDPLGQPRILDFGIAKAIDACGPGTDRTATVTGFGVGGTIPYMAPEQLGLVEGQEIDARADIHALGIIAFEALTGQLPYDGIAGEPVVRALGEFIAQSPRRLRSLDRRVPRGLDDLVASALARDPARRPASASALADALDRAAMEDSAAGRGSIQRWRSDPRLWAGVVGVGLAAGLVVRGAALQRGHPDSPPGPAASAPGQPNAEAHAGLDALVAEDTLPPGAEGLAALAELTQIATEATTAPELQRARWHLAIGNAALRRADAPMAMQQVGKAQAFLPMPASASAPEMHMLTALRARVLAARGNLLPASSQLQRARILAESLGDHAAAARYSAESAEVLLKMGRPVPAAACARTALDAATGAFGPDHVETALVRAVLARTLEGQSLLDEASAHAIQAHAVLGRAPDADVERLRQARESIEHLLGAADVEPSG